MASYEVDDARRVRVGKENNSRVVVIREKASLTARLPSGAMIFPFTWAKGGQRFYPQEQTEQGETKATAKSRNGEGEETGWKGRGQGRKRKGRKGGG